jgi:hypothetical protein
LARTPLAPLSAGVLVAVLLATVVPAAGSNWTLSLAAGSKGATQAKPGPPAPTGVTDVCVSPSGRTVTVSWNAVADASTYTVFKSTTTSTGTYSSTATGVTTNSWTSGTLTAGNYWFKVEAYVGTKWVSAQSAATPSETTIATTGTECQQP